MISFIRQQRKNPITQDLAWYPAISINANVGVNEIIYGIVEKCTLTKVDVKAVLIALEEVVIEQLKAGNSVRFGNLGSFRPTLRTQVWNEQKQRWEAGGCAVDKDLYNDKGELVAKGVSASNIKSIGVAFSKSSEMIQKLDRKQLQFQMLDVSKPYPTKTGNN